MKRKTLVHVADAVEDLMIETDRRRAEKRTERQHREG